jgi:hypothetical protein
VTHAPAPPDRQHGLRRQLGLLQTVSVSVGVMAPIGTYLVFPAVSISAAAVFARALLASLGVAPHAAWLPLAIGAWAVIWLIASREIRTAARSLLAFEAGSMVLILVLMGLVVAKLATGDAPAGYVLYHNLWPVSASPFDVFPYIVAAWLATGVIASRFV